MLRVEYWPFRGDKRGQFFQYILPGLDQFGALSDQGMTAAREGVVDGARDGEHLSALLRRETCRDERAALNIRLHHEGAEAHAADDAVATREVVRPRRRPGREFGNQCAAVIDDGVREFAVTGGVDAIEARAHHREGAAVLQNTTKHNNDETHNKTTRESETDPAEVG